MAEKILAGMEEMWAESRGETKGRGATLRTASDLAVYLDHCEEGGIPALLTAVMGKVTKLLCETGWRAVFVEGDPGAVRRWLRMVGTALHRVDSWCTALGYPSVHAMCRNLVERFVNNYAQDIANIATQLLDESRRCGDPPTQKTRDIVTALTDYSSLHLSDLFIEASCRYYSHFANAVAMDVQYFREVGRILKYEELVGGLHGDPERHVEGVKRFLVGSTQKEMGAKLVKKAIDEGDWETLREWKWLEVDFDDGALYDACVGKVCEDIRQLRPTHVDNIPSAVVKYVSGLLDIETAYAALPKGLREARLKAYSIMLNLQKDHTDACHFGTRYIAPADVLAFYCDTCIMNALPLNVAGLAPLIGALDDSTFFEQFRRDTARRLIVAKDWGRERKVLRELAPILSHHLKPLERMLDDKEHSDLLREEWEAEAPSDTPTLDPLVLTSGVWPEMRVVRGVVLPPCMSSLVRDYRRFFKKKFNGKRTLSWIYDLGRVTMLSGSSTLSVGTYQAAILSRFNKVDTATVSELADSIAIDEGIVERAVRLLVEGRVLQETGVPRQYAVHPDPLPQVVTIKSSGTLAPPTTATRLQALKSRVLALVQGKALHIDVLLKEVDTAVRPVSRRELKKVLSELASMGYVAITGETIKPATAPAEPAPVADEAEKKATSEPPAAVPSKKKRSDEGVPRVELCDAPRPPVSPREIPPPPGAAAKPEPKKARGLGWLRLWFWKAT